MRREDHQDRMSHRGPRGVALHAEPPALEELKEVIRKTIRVRRVTLATFLVVAVAIRLFMGVSFDPALLAAPLLWFGLTFPFKYGMERQRAVRTLHRLHAAFFTLELLLITYLVHLIGGVEWIGVIFYLFTVIYANFFLPKRLSRLITAAAISLYGTLVFLEYFGVWPHRTLFARPSYDGLAYVVISFLAAGLGVYTVLAYTLQIFVGLLRARERELKRLSVRLLAAEEEERRRIARRLHDEIGQSLATIKINLDLLRRDAKSPEVEESARLLGETLAAIRELSHGLRPPLLEQLGLAPALKELGERFSRAEDLEVRLEVEGVEGELPANLGQILYRAALEALANSACHARAHQVHLALRREGGWVRLTVHDDGRGFELDAQKGAAGLGLLGIRERVELAGGRLSLTSRPGEGTTLELALPVGDDDQDRAGR